MPSVEELLAEGVARLARHDSAKLDAELLLGKVLDRPREWLLAHPEEPVERQSADAFSHLLNRRAAGEPVAYLTGEREFFGRLFTVTPAVLVPRPESELLVSEALRILRPGDVVVDVGTGSGCIGITIAAERPDTAVHLVDVSEKALAVAERNAARLGVAVTSHQADLWPTTLDAKGTVVVANLPYVSDAGYEANPDLVHEPAVALRGGPDGLQLIRRLLERLEANPPRAVLLEIDPGQSQDLADSNWRASFSKDLAGRSRVAILTPALRERPVAL